MNKRLSENSSSRKNGKSAWRSDSGQAIACLEKIKVLNENVDELRQMAQDALEDGLLMGCSEAQLRAAFHALIDSLVNPYPGAAPAPSDQD